jgi:hypothetical protein
VSFVTARDVLDNAITWVGDDLITAKVRAVCVTALHNCLHRVSRVLVSSPAVRARVQWQTNFTVVADEIPRNDQRQPFISQFRVRPVQLNATLGQRAVLVSVSVGDEQSGVRTVHVVFSGPGGRQVTMWLNAESTLAAGTRLQGALQMRQTLDLSYSAAEQLPPVWRYELTELSIQVLSLPPLVLRPL